MSYVNPSSILAIGITFIATSISAVAARFCSRMRRSQKLLIDDWMAFAAMVFVIGASCIMIIGHATKSIGYHSPNIGLEIFTVQLPIQAMEKKLEYSFYLLQIPALLCLKLSTLLFYRRIFVGRFFVVCFWVLAIFSGLWGLSFFIAWSSICPHIESFYTSLETLKTQCGNSFAVLICQTVLDVLVDLAILILPAPLIWRLQMTTRRKLAVLAVFLLGGLAIACGLARMVVVAELLGTPLFSRKSIVGESTTDFMGIVSLLLFWGMLEIGIAMVAICLPTLGPLVHSIHPSEWLRSLRSKFSLSSLVPKASKRPESPEDAESSGMEDKGSDHIAVLTKITVDSESSKRGDGGQQASWNPVSPIRAL